MKRPMFSGGPTIETEVGVDSTIGYTTRTGSKYHAAGCVYLKAGGESITLVDASRLDD